MYIYIYNITSLPILGTSLPPSPPRVDSQRSPTAHLCPGMRAQRPGCRGTKGSHVGLYTILEYQYQYSMLNGKTGDLGGNHILPNIDFKIQRGAIKEVSGAKNSIDWCTILGLTRTVGREGSHVTS